MKCPLSLGMRMDTNSYTCLYFHALDDQFDLSVLLYMKWIGGKLILNVTFFFKDNMLATFIFNKGLNFNN